MLIACNQFKTSNFKLSLSDPQDSILKHSQKKVCVKPHKDDLSVHGVLNWHEMFVFIKIWMITSNSIFSLVVKQFFLSSRLLFKHGHVIGCLSFLPVTLSFIFFPDLLLWQLNTKHCTLYTRKNICMETLPNNFSWAKDCHLHCVMSCNVPWDIPLSIHFNLGHKKCIRVHFTKGGYQK